MTYWIEAAENDPIGADRIEAYPDKRENGDYYRLYVGEDETGKALTFTKSWKFMKPKRVLRFKTTVILLGSNFWNYTRLPNESFDFGQAHFLIMILNELFPHGVENIEQNALFQADAAMFNSVSF